MLVVVMSTAVAGEEGLLTADRLVEFSWRTFANPWQSTPALEGATVR